MLSRRYSFLFGGLKIQKKIRGRLHHDVPRFSATFWWFQGVRGVFWALRGVLRVSAVARRVAAAYGDAILL